LTSGLEVGPREVLGLVSTTGGLDGGGSGLQAAKIGRRRMKQQERRMAIWPLGRREVGTMAIVTSSRVEINWRVAERQVLGRERRAKPPAAIAGVAPATRLMRPVGFSGSFGRATDTPPILCPRGPLVNENPRPSPVRGLLDARSRSRHVTCMNRSLDGSGTPGAPAASIATSRQATQAVTDVIGRTSTDWPFQVDISYTVQLLVPAGVLITELDVPGGRNLLDAIRRRSYLRLTPQEYARAESKLIEAAPKV
jgi:hypothetical protein